MGTTGLEAMANDFIQGCSAGVVRSDIHSTATRLRLFWTGPVSQRLCRFDWTAFYGLMCSFFLTADLLDGIAPKLLAAKVAFVVACISPAILAIAWS